MKNNWTVQNYIDEGDEVVIVSNYEPNKIINYGFPESYTIIRHSTDIGIWRIKSLK